MDGAIVTVTLCDIDFNNVRVFPSQNRDIQDVREAELGTTTRVYVHCFDRVFIIIGSL